MESMVLIDVFILGAGLYLLYATIRMKQTGDIKKGVLMGKNVDFNQVKDPQGYIRSMFGINLALGLTAALCGGLGIAGRFLPGLIHFYGASLLLFVVVFCIYMALVVRAQKKYL